jgi:quercetin dioxygenase-like cupin family protein
MRGAPEEQPASLPAVLVATPSPEVAQETRFTATLPAEMIPTAPGDRTFNVWHVELEPGARVPITGQLPGPQITHVVAGELTVRVDGPLRVYRGGGIGAKEEQVPPGTEVVLQPGDTAVYAYDSPAEYANLGTTPVHLVGGELGVGVMPGAAVPLTFIDYGEKYPLPALPPGPVRATIVQAALPPDGLFPAPPAGSLRLAVGESEISLGENSDGSLRNINPQEVTVYVLTLTPAGEVASTPTP